MNANIEAVKDQIAKIAPANDTQVIKDQLATLLKNWNNVDQDWWVNAVKHSIKHCGKFTLVGWVTTTGKDEQIKVEQNV